MTEQELQSLNNVIDSTVAALNTLLPTVADHDKAKRAFMDVSNTLAMLRRLDFSHITPGVLSSSDLIKELKAIRELARRRPDVAAVLNGLPPILDRVQRASATAVAFVLALEHAAYFENERKDLVASSEVLLTQGKENLKGLIDHKAEADELVTRLQKMHDDEAATHTVSTYAKNFSATKDAYDKSSSFWAKLTGGFAATTLLVALLTVFLPRFPWVRDWMPAENLGDGWNVQYTIGKVLILSILSSAAAFAAKNYFAARHNAVVNEHRSNALATFKTLYTATEDPNIKDAVLLETTRAIYSAQGTGYSKAGEGSQQPIIEIARSLGAK